MPPIGWSQQGLGTILWDGQCCSSGNTSSPAFLLVHAAVQEPFPKTRGVLNNLVLLSDSDREKSNWWTEQVNLWKQWSLVAPTNWIKITLDVSVWGWRAVCNSVTTEWPWSQNETLFQINYLQSSSPLVFPEGPPTSSNSLSLHGQYFSHFLLQSQRRDNIIIPMQSSQGDLAMVHVSEHLTIVANHLPGHLNMVADAEPRILRDHWDWQLHPANFHKITLKWGLFTVDLFASRLAHHLPVYFTWRRDPQAASATNLCLYKEILCKSSTVTDVEHPLGDQPSTSRSGDITPVWKSQSLYPVLLSSLFDFPHLITFPPDQMLSQGSPSPPFCPQEIQLAAWLTSGNTAKQKSYQKKLQNSTRHLGEASPQCLLTQSFTSARVSALHRTEIPFWFCSRYCWLNCTRMAMLIAHWIYLDLPFHQCTNTLMDIQLGNTHKHPVS